VDRVYQEIVPGQEYTLEVRANEPTEYSVLVLTRTNEAPTQQLPLNSTPGDFNRDSEIDFLILSANYGNS